MMRRPSRAPPRELNAYYPGDPGVLAALLMNRITPAAGGCACTCPPGNLHAYLSGGGWRSWQILTM